MKGHPFTVITVAVDQANHTVSAIINSYLKDATSRLGEGEHAKRVPSTCSKLTFKVYSSKDNETLSLYAAGPCKDIGISKSQLLIKFNACSCPTGFQQSQEISKNHECACICDSQLLPFLSDCNASTASLTRKGNYWINSIDLPNETVFFLYAFCPFDYCHPASHTVRSVSYTHLTLPTIYSV